MQNNEIFVPQTTAEAVLVKHNNAVKRLDVVLEQKLETISSPLDSGLKVLKTGPTSITITHENEVTPITNDLKPLLLTHDSHGHITKSQTVKSLKIIVADKEPIEYNGVEEKTIQMGDDFTLDENNKIKLNWNNL